MSATSLQSLLSLELILGISEYSILQLHLHTTSQHFQELSSNHLFFSSNLATSTFLLMVMMAMKNILRSFQAKLDVAQFQQTLDIHLLEHFESISKIELFLECVSSNISHFSFLFLLFQQFLLSHSTQFSLFLLLLLLFNC